MMVTVLCMAYNHAAYIREALEGFVRQQTDFPFEVLVHDDASTDGTADIIREYAARYPALIRPFYETENQYSKGVRIALDILSPHIRGRYVALCEGDDYWTHPYKLQKQVDALEAHPQVDICAHLTRKFKNGRLYGHVGPFGPTRIIPAWRVIWAGGGFFAATCSLMCRREVYLQDTPMRRILFLDYTLQIQGALRGGMLYLNEGMAVYRRGVPGSWTSDRGKGRKREHFRKFKQMLDALNQWTGGRYRFVIQARKRRIDLHRFFLKVL